MVLSPDMCLIRGACLELLPHLFLHCSAAHYSIHSFGLSGECSTCPSSLDQFLVICLQVLGLNFCGIVHNLCYTSIYGWCVILVSLRLFLLHNSWILDKIRHLDFVSYKAHDFYSIELFDSFS